MSRNHIASCGIMGTNPFTGEKTKRRIGTRFAHTNLEAWDMMGKPYFKFRNNELRSKWFEWQEAKSAEISRAELEKSTRDAFPPKTNDIIKLPEDKT